MGRHIYIYIYIYIYMSQARKRGLKEMTRFGAFIIIGDSDVDSGGFTDEPWQFQCTCTMVFLAEKWNR